MCLPLSFNEFGIGSRTRHLDSLPYTIMQPRPDTVLVMIDLRQVSAFLASHNWQHYFDDEEWKQLRRWYSHGGVHTKINGRISGRIAVKLAVQHLRHVRSLNQVVISHCMAAPFKGKPICNHDCHISVSHSGDCIVAIASEQWVGVDVQHYKDFGLSAMKYAFSASEKRHLLHAHAMDKQRISATVWAIKEAYLKALGVGIFPYIQDVEVDIIAGMPVTVSMKTHDNDAIPFAVQSTPPNSFTSSKYSLAYVEMADMPLTKRYALDTQPIEATT